MVGWLVLSGKFIQGEATMKTAATILHTRMFSWYSGASVMIIEGLCFELYLQAMEEGSC